MTGESTTHAGDGTTSFVPRVWRIPLWIRVVCLAQALGWLALCGVLGLTGREGPLFWGVLAAFVIVVPYLAVRPRIHVRSDGTLLLSGWLHMRKTGWDQVTRLSMTQYGLRFSFADGSHFTSVVFQPTRHIRRPRVLEFVEGMTGQTDLRVFDPWDAARNGGIELYLKGGNDSSSSRGETGPAS